MVVDAADSDKEDVDVEHAESINGLVREENSSLVENVVQDELDEFVRVASEQDPG